LTVPKSIPNRKLEGATKLQLVMFIAPSGTCLGRCEHGHNFY
jgi:hypothetical protein